jgi:hypothetical protein
MHQAHPAASPTYSTHDDTHGQYGIVMMVIHRWLSEINLRFLRQRIEA